MRMSQLRIGLLFLDVFGLVSTFLQYLRCLGVISILQSMRTLGTLLNACFLQDNAVHTHATPSFIVVRAAHWWTTLSPQNLLCVHIPSAFHTITHSESVWLLGHISSAVICQLAEPNFFWSDQKVKRAIEELTTPWAEENRPFLSLSSELEKAKIQRQ